jgi:hypothetical protein
LYHVNNNPVQEFTENTKQSNVKVVLVAFSVLIGGANINPSWDITHRLRDMLI